MPGCDRLLPELTLPGLHESLIERLLQLPDVGSETAVLDIGCGSGAWLARLAQHGFKRLHGVDNQSFVTFPLADETGASFSCTYADPARALHRGNDLRRHHARSRPPDHRRSVR